ncbi:MAG: HupE/UreJ family protein [Armatimonas sp.]
MKRLCLFLTLLFLPLIARAHQLQIEPIGVTIEAQNAFLLADFKGNVQDITQSVDATEADERGDEFTELINQKVEAYFNERFVLSQNGKPLKGKLELLTHQGNLPSDKSQFHMQIRYPRDPKTTDVITIKNTTLDYLPNARVIVSIGGTARMMATNDTITIDPKTLYKNLLQNISEFTWMGMEHIFTGFDHILFILALLIASVSLRDLVKILTGFTIAHSITLCLAALNLFTLPSQLVETLIPLSIIYVGLENLFLKTHKHRLWIASAFGLVHGFGFADILGKYLPADSSKLWCLFSFNLGIEIFQVGLCALVFPLLMLLRAKTDNPKKTEGLTWEILFKGTSIGITLAGSWFLLRTMGLV